MVQTLLFHNSNTLSSKKIKWIFLLLGIEMWKTDWCPEVNQLHLYDDFNV